MKWNPRKCRPSTSARSGQSDLYASVDCAGAREMMQLGFSLLSIIGHYADVGLVGDRIDIPLFRRIPREKIFAFDQISDSIELLRTGETVGRAVMKCDRLPERAG